MYCDHILPLNQVIPNHLSFLIQDNLNYFSKTNNNGPTHTKIKHQPNRRNTKERDKNNKKKQVPTIITKTTPTKFWPNESTFARLSKNKQTNKH